MKNFKPILFGTPMVQAILEDRKTQTRRIIKSKHESGLFQVCSRKTDGKITEITSLDWDERPKNDCTNDIQPLAKIGDILWVRETFAEVPFLHPVPHHKTIYRADGHKLLKTEKWKPSIFMPKGACRIFLEVTNVRVERLQNISDENAIAEGIKRLGLNVFDNEIFKNYLDKGTLESGFEEPVKSFQSLWQSINGPESWEENPWVWVYDFKRIEKPKEF